MATRPFYTNGVTLRDGKVLLYQRADTQKPIWWMRIKLPGVNDYIKRSCKTTNLGEANTLAEDEYDELRYKARHNIPLITLTFNQIWEKWWAVIGRRKKEARRVHLEKMGRRYLKPFFGTTKITNINPTSITEYWKWRLDYWTNGPGAIEKDNTRFFKSTPKLATLKHERQTLLQVLRWGVSQNFLTALPEIALPEMAQEEDDDSIRPAFTLAQYKRLCKFIINQYIPKPGKETEFWAANVKLNSAHVYGRRMLQNYIRVGVNSGLRPHEMKLLKWKHVVFFSSGDVGHVKFNIPKNTKTGARTTMCMPNTVDYLNDIRLYSKHTGNEDHVFATQKGKKPRDFWKMMKRLLKAANLETDIWGNSFSPNSTRHTYITLRMLYGDLAIEDLARNVGNSKEIIQKHYDHVVNEMKLQELTSMKKR